MLNKGLSHKKLTSLDNKLTISAVGEGLPSPKKNGITSEMTRAGTQLTNPTDMIK